MSDELKEDEKIADTLEPSKAPEIEEEEETEVDPYEGLTPGRAATLRAHDAKRKAFEAKSAS